MTREVHEVYAVRYGHHDRPTHENYIGGDPHDTNEPLAYFVWAIKGPHGTFVMDTGFDPAIAAKRGRVIVKPVRPLADARHRILTHRPDQRQACARLRRSMYSGDRLGGTRTYLPTFTTGNASGAPRACARTPTRSARGAGRRILDRQEPERGQVSLLSGRGSCD